MHVPLLTSVQPGRWSCAGPELVHMHADAPPVARPGEFAANINMHAHHACAPSRQLAADGPAAIAQVFLMPVLLTVAGEHAMMIVAFLGSIAKLLGLSAATAKWQCFASICVGSLYFMAFPAISSIKANAVAEHEQGAVQGAVAGVQALASGAGPLLFMTIYNRFIVSNTPRVRAPAQRCCLGTPGAAGSWPAAHAVYAFALKYMGGRRLCLLLT